MAYIESKQLASAVVKYEEDIESVTIYPQTGEIEVKTYKRFYDSEGNIVKTEAGKTEKFKHDVSDLAKQLTDIIKQRRAK